MICNSKYGNYRTRKFIDIFKSVEDFIDEYKSNGIPTTIHYGETVGTTVQPQTAQTLYYLLYARFGNSCIANSDENQFKYKVWMLIFQYAPTWEKKVELQQKIRNLTDDEILAGSKSIFNHSFNPSVEPTTSTLEELPTINEQNTNNYKRGKLDAYAMVYQLLENDVSEEFLNRFKDLFLTFVKPQRPLWYVSDVIEEEQED